MSAKHTPGPWTVTPESYGEPFGSRTVNGPEFALVAVVWNGNSEGQEEANGNARLIAVAPELLEALRECASMLQDNYEALGYATQPAAVTRAYALLDKLA
jgi:hypothetical protein